MALAEDLTAELEDDVKKHLLGCTTASNRPALLLQPAVPMQHVNTSPACVCLQIEIYLLATPDVTGFFEVEITEDEGETSKQMIHSRMNGDGFVDSQVLPASLAPRQGVAVSKLSAPLTQ
eukprot:COSAG02_NODE_4313_length_5521_cov_6.383991_1_plen_120_part_00